MTNNEKIPWLRISAEAVAIVGGILLAFSIDAWWDMRSERALESQLLGRLKGELQENVERLERFGTVTSTIDASVTIVKQLEDALARDLEVIDAREIGRLPVAVTFDFSTAVLDGVVRSGLADVIRNEDVVIGLAEWEKQIRNYEDVATSVRNMTEMVLVPALVQRSEISSVLLIRIAAQRGAEVAYPDDIQLRVDPEITGLIAQKTFGLAVSEAALNDALGAAKAAIEAIDAAHAEE